LRLFCLAKTINPYQGLKPFNDGDGGELIFLAKTINPYQGLKREIAEHSDLSELLQKPLIPIRD